MIINPLVKFHVYLLFILCAVFGIHYYLLTYELLITSISFLSKSYLINFFLASFVFSGIYIVRKTQTDLLGFYFLGGSFFKFLIFFILIYPALNSDNSLSRIEFLMFFIPYCTSLLVETTQLIKLLNTEA